MVSTSDPNYDRLSKNVDKLYQMMEKMVVTQNRNLNQNQNQNFRRNNTAPNRQKESDQQVIPPFQNFLDEYPLFFMVANIFQSRRRSSK